MFAVLIATHDGNNKISGKINIFRNMVMLGSPNKHRISVRGIRAGNAIIKTLKVN